MTIIFNKDLIRQNFSHISKKCKPQDLYLHKFSEEIILDKLSHISKKFNKIFIYGLFDTTLLPKNINHSDSNITHVNIASTGLYKNEKIADEEALNTHPEFQHSKFDLIISNLTMQHNNDVIAALSNYHKMLTPGGMFLCNFLGGNTLIELKNAMLKTDIALFNKAFSRVIPMIEIKQMGNLLQRVRFDIPFSASETIIVEFSDLITMLYELKRMALGNYMHNRVWHHHKMYFKLLEENYVKEFSQDLNTRTSSKLQATFELITAFGSKA